MLLPAVTVHRHILVEIVPFEHVHRALRGQTSPLATTLHTQWQNVRMWVCAIVSTDNAYVDKVSQVHPANSWHVRINATLQDDV